MGYFSSRCGGENGCPFFDQESVSKVSRERGQGICRVGAPQAKDPHWPTVHESDWCGTNPNIAISVQRVMQQAQMDQMQQMMSGPSSKLSVVGDLPPELLRP